MKRIPYKDLGDDPEDECIRQIGEHCIGKNQVVGFFVDDEEGKAERYISKLEARFPGIRATHRGPGSVASTVLVKVEPPLN